MTVFERSVNSVLMKQWTRCCIWQSKVCPAEKCTKQTSLDNGWNIFKIDFDLWLCFLFLFLMVFLSFWRLFLVVFFPPMWSSLSGALVSLKQTHCVCGTCWFCLHRYDDGKWKLLWVYSCTGHNVQLSVCVRKLFAFDDSLWTFDDSLLTLPTCEWGGGSCSLDRRHGNNLYAIAEWMWNLTDFFQNRITWRKRQYLPLNVIFVSLQNVSDFGRKHTPNTAE